MSIDFLFGRGFLSLRQQRLGPWGTLDELRMEVPDLRFPFDARGGVSRFRQVRSRLQLVRLTLSESGLGALIEDAALQVEGFSEIRCRFLEGAIFLSANTSLLSSEGTIACRLAPAPAMLGNPLRVHLVPIELTGLGHLAVPAPVLLGELLRRLLGTPALSPLVEAWKPAVDGDTLTIEPLAVLLSELFLPIGWKLPGTDRLSSLSLDLSPGAAVIEASGPDANPTSRGQAHFVRDTRSGPLSARALAALEAREALPEAETALFTGRLELARDLYHAYCDRPGAPDCVVQRTLELFLTAGNPEDRADAERIARTRLEHDPEDRVALQAMSRLYPGDMAHAQRLREALRAASLTPELVLTAITTARQILPQGGQAAEEAISSLVRVAPSHPEALELAIAQARSLGDLARLEDALRRRASSPVSRSEKLGHLLELARLALRRRGDTAEARLWLDRARSIAPENPHIYTELAAALEAEQRWPDAIRAWDTAARSFIDDGDTRAAANARRDAARIWKDHLRQPAAALSELRRAMDVLPDHLPTLLDAAGLCLETGQLDNALVLAHAALDAARSDGEGVSLARALDCAARIEAERHQPEAAAGLRRELLQLKPEDGDNLASLAELLQRQGRVDELVDLHLTRLRGASPAEAVHLHEQLARLHHEFLELPTTAAEHWTQVLRLQPDRRDALENLVQILHGRGMDLELVAILCELAEHVHDVAWRTEFLTQGAHAAWNTGDSATAEELARRAVEHNPRSPDPWRAAASYLPEPERTRARSTLAERVDDPAEAAEILAKLGDEAFTAPDRAREAVGWYRRALLLRDDPHLRARLVTAAERAGLDPERALPMTSPELRSSGASEEAPVRDIKPVVLAATVDDQPDSPAPRHADDRGSDRAAESSALGPQEAEERAEVLPSTPPPQEGEPGMVAEQADAGGKSERETLRQEVERVRANGDSGAMAAALEALAEAKGPAVERARVAAELGTLLYHDLEEVTRARYWLEEARQLDPSGAGARYEVLTTLEAIYEEADAPEALLEIYRQKLEDTSDPSMREVFRLLMATVLFERLRRPEDALALTRDALRDAPGHIPSMRLQAEVLDSMGDAGGAADALRRVLDRRELDPFERQEVLRDLGNLEWRQLRQLDLAASRFEALIEEIPGDTECLSALKQIHGAKEDWSACARVLWRELGLLVGAIDAFGDAEDVIRYPMEQVPALLGGTFARILAEGAEVLARIPERRDTALELLERASRHSPEEPFVLEARIRTGQLVEDHVTVARAAEQLAELLLLPEERAKLVGVAIEAWEEAGQAERAAALRQMLPTGSGDGYVAETVDEIAESAAGHGEHLDAAEEPVREVVQEPEPEDDGTPSLARLDRLAASGQFQEALQRIEAWLPVARVPSLRRELLLRKGRWIIDQTGSGRDAVLVLKGALILDEDAADTRFELMRAHVRNGELRLAMDQLKELVGLGVGHRSIPGLNQELARLRTIAEPAELARIDQLVERTGSDAGP